MRNALRPQADRRVGRLRIRAWEESQARHTSTMLQDALRTASLPVAEQGQMLVVRKLPLGRISPRASSTTLALRVELAMSEARSSAISFTLPAAAGANAVIFPGRAEALVALARRHARAPETKDWFWGAVVAEWGTPLSRPQRWLALLEAAHSLPEGAVAAAHILREALHAGVEDELLRSIKPGLGAEWLRRAGWNWSESCITNVGIPDHEHEVRALSGRHQEVINRWEPRLGSRSEQLVWLATILSVIENPVRAADPRLAVVTARRLAFSRTKTGTHERDTSESSPGPLNETRSRSSAIKTSAVTDTKLVIGSSFDESRGFAEKNVTQPAEMRPCSLEFSPFAGLLFLVPVLERLGFAEFVAANPNLLECGFPAQLLRFVGARVGMPSNDPLALALDLPPASKAALPVWTLPAAARQLLAHPVPRACLDSVFVAWLTATRRWCRRHARLGLVDLIRRPGHVAISQTQIDVFFDLIAVDLRLRRLALDVDPGWVPWLGRVARFHYLDNHEHAI